MFHTIDLWIIIIYIYIYIYMIHMIFLFRYGNIYKYINVLGIIIINNDK